MAFSSGGITIRWTWLLFQAPHHPPDSVGGPTWFSRGTQGLSSLLKGRWKEKQYYLGEWHFHPEADPAPSPTDEGQLCEISVNRNYHCATPLLLIMGGNPQDIWAASFRISTNRETSRTIMSHHWSVLFPRIGSARLCLPDFCQTFEGHLLL